jgi:hypothetical protein
MLIGISGKIKSGKDTVGEMLYNLGCIEYSIYKYSFADSLKKIVASIVDCDYRSLNNQEFKASYIPNFMKITKDGIITHIVPCSKIFYKDIFRTYEVVTYREALQFFGDKFRSEYGQDFWIRMLKSDLVSESTCLSIITDVRYKNEADFIKSNKGILIRVDRPEIQVSRSISSHSSETELDNYPNFDYIIENNGTLEELESKVRLIYNSIKKFRHC